MTLLFDTAADAQIPTVGASGAMAAVLGRLFRALSQLTRPHARAPISSPGRTCAAVEEAVLCKCKLPVEAGVDHAPRPIVWALRRDGWRSCRRARRSGGSCPDRARDRGAPQNRPKSAINRFTFDRPKVPDHLVMPLDTPRVVRRAGAAVPAQRRRHLQ